MPNPPFHLSCPSFVRACRRICWSRLAARDVPPSGRFSGRAAALVSGRSSPGWPWCLTFTRSPPPGARAPVVLVLPSSCTGPAPGAVPMSPFSHLGPRRAASPCRWAARRVLGRLFGLLSPAFSVRRSVLEVSAWSGGRDSLDPAPRSDVERRRRRAAAAREAPGPRFTASEPRKYTPRLIPRREQRDHLGGAAAQNRGDQVTRCLRPARGPGSFALGGGIGRSVGPSFASELAALSWSGPPTTHSPPVHSFGRSGRRNCVRPAAAIIVKARRPARPPVANSTFQVLGARFR